jgi:hypothetical protein
MSHWLQKVVAILKAETADLRELAHLAGGNPETFYRGAKMDGVDLSGQDLRGMEFTNLDLALVWTDSNTRLDEPAAPADTDVPRGDADTSARIALLELKDSTRQELRLAIVFDTIFSSLQVGKILLDRYYSHDRAVFADRVVENLRSILLRNDSVLAPAAVRRELQRVLSHFYGLRKGQLLLDFAERLGKYEEINQMIKWRLDRSQSIYVMPFDKPIRAALSKGARHHQKGPQGLPLFQQRNNL